MRYHRGGTNPTGGVMKQDILVRGYWRSQNEMLQGGYHNKRHQESRYDREGGLEKSQFAGGALLQEILLGL